MEILNFNEWFVQLPVFDARKSICVCSVLNREKNQFTLLNY